MADGKLTPLKISRLKEPGRYIDGRGLYLQITPTEAAVRDPEKHRGEVNKSWLYRYHAKVPRKKDGVVRGLVREMGLGRFPAVTLADARSGSDIVKWCRDYCAKLRSQGIDPIEARKAERAQKAVEMAKTVTFKQAAERYIKANRQGWKNEKHAAQWEATLKAYAYPTFGHLPVQAIDTALLLKALEPIWETKSETACRVRGRIEAVLAAATVRGERTGDNPARWKGHLAEHLPRRSKVRKVENHPALPYAELAGFMAALRAEEGIGARALEFTILTAARSGETRKAAWSQMELPTKVWTCPPEIMKAGKEHRVPLCARAINILGEMVALREDGSELVFPGADSKKPLSDMTLTAVIRRMNEGNEAAGRPKWIDPRYGKEIVPHGFRSTFRDWAAERTNFPNELLEMALAHTIPNKAEAAYRRGDMFERRRRLMTAWEDFASKPSPKGGNASSIRQAG
jgi:integrase